MIAAPFHGLLFDLRIADPPLAAWEVKRDVHCPPVHVQGDPTAGGDGDGGGGGVYLRFNEGAGVVAAGGAVTGIPAGAWVNASSPASLVRDPASSRLTTFGAARLVAPAGAAAAWTVQRRGACGARLRGGIVDDQQVSADITVVGVQGAPLFNSTGGLVGHDVLVRQLSVKSHGDGGASVAFVPGPALLNFPDLHVFSCSQAYDMTARVGGAAAAATFRVSIPAGDISAASSSASVRPPAWTVGVRGGPETQVGEDIELGCFGAPTVIVVTTVDSALCPRAGDESHVFVARLIGPGDAHATSRPIGDGVYELTLVPPAPGSYQLEVGWVTSPDNVDGDSPTPLGNLPRFSCRTVCAGNSLAIAPQDDPPPPTAAAVVPHAPAMDASPAAMSWAVWYRSVDAPRVDNAILTRDEVNDLAGVTRSFRLALGTGERAGEVEVRVDIGHGRVVHVAAAATAGSGWKHVAATFEAASSVGSAGGGGSLKLYLDGVQVGASPVPAGAALARGARPAAPLSVGVGLSGGVDEVVVWSRVLTAAEVAVARSCAPTAAGDLAGVIVYAAFNEAEGAPTSAVYSASCGLASHHLCPRAAINSNTTRLEVGTPLTEQAVSGYGVLSADRSVVTVHPPDPIPAGADAGAAHYRVLARDVCGFRHTSGDAAIDAITSRQVAVHEGPAAFPAATGGRYPITVVALAPATTPPAVSSGAARCPGLDPHDPVAPLGDEYVGAVPLTQAGAYNLTLRAGGAALPGYPRPVVVAAGRAARFELAAPAVLPATHSVSVRLRAFDTNQNVIEAPAAFQCEVTLIAASHTFGVSIAHPGPLVHRLLSAPGAGLGADIAGAVLRGAASGTGGKGWYALILELDGPGAYSLVCVPPAATDQPLVHRLVVGASEWRALSPAPRGPVPGPRFKPAAAAAGDNLVLFGGAGQDQEYLGDAWVLPAAADARHALGFRKTITAAHGRGAGLEASTVRVVVNTAELVDAGRLGPSCADVRFEAPAPSSAGGAAAGAGGGASTPTTSAAVTTVLTHWLDPRPGCGAANTVFWVRLPAGVLGAGAAANAAATTLYMAYGNPAFGEEKAAAVAAGDYVGGWPGPPPADLFVLYEGFETATPGAAHPPAPTTRTAAAADIAAAVSTLAALASTFTPVRACGAAQPEPSAFQLATPARDNGGLAAAGLGALAATGYAPGDLPYTLNPFFI